MKRTVVAIGIGADQIARLRAQGSCSFYAPKPIAASLRADIVTVSDGEKDVDTDKDLEAFICMPKIIDSGGRLVRVVLTTLYRPANLKSPNRAGE